MGCKWKPTWKIWACRFHAREMSTKTGWTTWQLRWPARWLQWPLQGCCIDHYRASNYSVQQAATMVLQWWLVVVWEKQQGVWKKKHWVIQRGCQLLSEWCQKWDHSWWRVLQSWPQQGHLWVSFLTRRQSTYQVQTGNHLHGCLLTMGCGGRLFQIEEEG